MQKLIYLIILIIFTACGSSPDYQEVMVNKTVKVYSQDYHNEAENYTFKWEPPKGPSKKAISFDLKNDMLIFSPEIEGDYQIHLSITDISDEVIAEEMFYYRAIVETVEVAIAKIKPEEEILPPPSVVKKPKKKTTPKVRKKKSSKSSKKTDRQSKTSRKSENVDYTIQIAAWPSLEQARKDQLRLIEEGYDAYIERHYRKEKDAIWYRVRIGKFSNKNKALEIQKQVESILGIKSWLDVISLK